MVYSDTSTSQGLLQDTRFLSGTDANNYPTADVNRALNRFYYSAVIEAWRSSNNWIFDDTNQSNFAVATTTLVDSQPDYSIPTNALRIKRVEVLDASGNWKVVQPFDPQQLVNTALDEFMETDGRPQWYRMEKNSVILYPAPDSGGSVTLASGLKIYFDREVDEFTASDTTQEPGLAEPFHRILSLGAAYDFVAYKKKDFNAADRLMNDLNKLMQQLRDFYSTRNKNAKLMLRRRMENYA